METARRTRRENAKIRSANASQQQVDGWGNESKTKERKKRSQERPVVTLVVSTPKTSTACAEWALALIWYCRWEARAQSERESRRSTSGESESEGGGGGGGRQKWKGKKLQFVSPSWSVDSSRFAAALLQKRLLSTLCTAILQRFAPRNTHTKNKIKLYSSAGILKIQNWRRLADPRTAPTNCQTTWAPPR